MAGDWYSLRGHSHTSYSASPSVRLIPVYFNRLLELEHRQVDRNTVIACADIATGVGGMHASEAAEVHDSCAE